VGPPSVARAARVVVTPLTVAYLMMAKFYILVTSCCCGVEVGQSKLKQEYIFFTDVFFTKKLYKNGFVKKLNR